MIFDLDLIKTVYKNFKTKTDEAKKLLNRPMTYTEKILYTHLWWNTPGNLPVPLPANHTLRVVASYSGARI